MLPGRVGEGRADPPSRLIEAARVSDGHEPAREFLDELAGGKTKNLKRSADLMVRSEEYSRTGKAAGPAPVE